LFNKNPDFLRDSWRASAQPMAMADARYQFRKYPHPVSPYYRYRLALRRAQFIR